MSTILHDLKTLLTSRYFLILLVSLVVLFVFVLVSIGSIILKQDGPFFETFYQVSAEFISKPFVACLQAAAFALGIWRACFHPVVHDKYCNWLATTPWTPRHPLPLGPWHPIAADYLVLAFLSAVSYLIAWVFNLPISLWLVTLGPFLLFATSLTLFWISNNLALNQTKNAYLTISIPVFFAVIGIPTTYLVFCPVIMAVISGYGVQQSLDSFPWDEKYLDEGYQYHSEKSFKIIGWPYRELLRTPQDMTTTKVRASVESIITGCWAGLLLSWIEKGNPNEDMSIFMMLIGIVVLWVSCFKIGRSSSAICSQLCWGQRLANRRWVIPAHDIIFLAPALIALIGTTLPAILYNGLEISLPIACGFPICFRRLPRPRRWSQRRKTPPHRRLL